MAEPDGRELLLDGLSALWFRFTGVPPGRNGVARTKSVTYMSRKSFITSSHCKTCNRRLSRDDFQHIMLNIPPYLDRYLLEILLREFLQGINPYKTT